mmetsp:Transcript_70397/g.139656  ORF Transcript_70397/g.139656 Transcript_70397/m.139656 type:complete len:216 (+) Transcript_70397:262-909(+)
MTGLFRSRRTFSVNPCTLAGVTSTTFFEFSPGKHLRTSTPWKSLTNLSHTPEDLKLMKPYPTLHLFLKSIGKYMKSYSPLKSTFSCLMSISRVYLLGMFRNITVVQFPIALLSLLVSLLSAGVVIAVCFSSAPPAPPACPDAASLLALPLAGGLSPPRPPDFPLPARPGDSSAGRARLLPLPLRLPATSCSTGASCTASSWLRAAGGIGTCSSQG